MGLFEWVSAGLKGARAETSGPPAPGPCKWLPRIDRDYCTGCNACVEACDHGCLGQVWDFATLLRPEDCGSEGRCMEACPENLIRMEWVPLSGSPATGRWKISGGPAAEPA